MLGTGTSHRKLQRVDNDSSLFLDEPDDNINTDKININTNTNTNSNYYFCREMSRKSLKIKEALKSGEETNHPNPPTLPQRQQSSDGILPFRTSTSTKRSVAATHTEYESDSMRSFTSFHNDDDDDDDDDDDAYYNDDFCSQPRYEFDFGTHLLQTNECTMPPQAQLPPPIPIVVLQRKKSISSFSMMTRSTHKKKTKNYDYDHDNDNNDENLDYYYCRPNMNRVTTLSDHHNKTHSNSKTLSSHHSRYSAASCSGGGGLDGSSKHSLVPPNKPIRRDSATDFFEDWAEETDEEIKRESEHIILLSSSSSSPKEKEHKEKEEELLKDEYQSDTTRDAVPSLPQRMPTKEDLSELGLFLAYEQ